MEPTEFFHWNREAPLLWSGNSPAAALLNLFFLQGGPYHEQGLHKWRLRLHPNQSIKCTVNNCANHCQDKDYCGLTSIQVGTHESNPTMVECTDCQSFRMK